MKPEFRKKLKAENPTAEENQRAHQLLQKSLAHFFKDKKTLRGAAFKAQPAEIDVETEGFGDSPWSIHWAFPRLEGNKMQFMHPGENGFVESSLKILEPVVEGATLAPVESLDFVLMPGVAFSTKGHRLGRGKGHYDRALADYKGIKIGIAKQDRIYNEIPTEAHDVTIHSVVTPAGVLYFSGGM